MRSSRARLRELWRISGFVYRESAYQLAYMQRAGSLLPQAAEASLLAERATGSMLLNKVIVAVVLSASGALSAVVNFAPEWGDAASNFAFFLVTLFAFMMFVFLQPMTSFVSVRVAELLAPLPLSRSEAATVALLAFTRLFDVPIAAVAVVVPTAYAVAYRSPLAWSVALLGVVASSALALAASFALARSFYTKVLRGGGSSVGATLLRIAGMLAWVFAATLLYLPYLLFRLVEGLAQAALGALGLQKELLAGLASIIYPFPFAYLLAFAVGQEPGAPPLLPALAAVGYTAAAAAAARWLTRGILEVHAAGLPVAAAAGPLALKTTHPWLAVVKKDLRLASRSPSHAFTVFAPLAFGIYMALVWANEWAPTLGLAFLSLGSAVTLLSTEALAQSITGALPLTKRLLLSAKISLAMGVYLLSTVAAAAAAAVSGKAAIPLALLALAHAPAVAASAAVLLLIAYRLSEDGALPSDLYSRFAHLLLPLVAGFLLLLLPALVYGVALWLLKYPAPLALLALTATLELAVAAAVLAASK